jgi:lactam utilization protein B
MKNRKREICTSGTVRDEDGNILIYSAIAVTIYGDGASAGRNASERRANLEKDNAQADPTGLSGKADMAG